MILKIETFASAEEVDKFVQLIKSETEIVYIVAGGWSGHIRIEDAEVMEEEEWWPL